MTSPSTDAPLIPAAKPKPFDLADRYAAPTADVVIVDPADLTAKIDTGLRIRIRSMYSDEAKQAATSERAKLKLVNGKVDASDAQWEVNLFEQTVAIVDGWWDENGDVADCIVVAGVATPCTADTVRAVFTDPRTAWLQKQVQGAYLDIGRFFPKPKTA
jgi:hypothetical protein